MQPFLPHLSAPENADFKLHVCQLQLPLHHLPSASSLGSMGNLIFWILKPGMHLQKLRLSILDYFVFAWHQIILLGRSRGTTRLSLLFRRHITRFSRSSGIYKSVDAGMAHDLL